VTGSTSPTRRKRRARDRCAESPLKRAENAPVLRCPDLIGVFPSRTNCRALGKSGGAFFPTRFVIPNSRFKIKFSKGLVAIQGSKFK
jgi:hypothetical protein